MSEGVLLSLVEAADRSVLGRPDLIAAEASEVVALCTHGSAEVRALAVEVLSQSGHPQALEAVTARLGDPDLMVQGAAVAGLFRTLPKTPPGPQLEVAVARVLAALDRPGEPALRENMALCLGMAQAPPIEALRARVHSELDAVVRDAELCAMAYAGDPAAQEGFCTRLAGAREADRVRLLELADFVRKPWLLATLSNLLQDTSPALRLLEGHATIPPYLRTCDLAARLLITISGVRPSFDATLPRWLSQEQLEELRFVVSRVQQTRDR